MTTSKPSNIDDYIAGFPVETQLRLKKIRVALRKAAKGAEETISYGIPAFMLHKSYIIYFAGYKKHVSIYPVPPGNEAFKKEIAPYRTGKGTLQFSLDKPLPMTLITKIAKNCMKANVERTKLQKKNKKNVK